MVIRRCKKSASQLARDKRRKLNHQARLKESLNHTFKSDNASSSGQTDQVEQAACMNKQTENKLEIPISSDNDNMDTCSTSENSIPSADALQERRTTRSMTFSTSMNSNYSPQKIQDFTFVNDTASQDIVSADCDRGKIVLRFCEKCHKHWKSYMFRMKDESGFKLSNHLKYFQWTCSFCNRIRQTSDRHVIQYLMT